ncbi:MAG: MFS transporter [Paraclostridium sp.]
MFKNKELLKNKNFCFLIIASFISTIGTIIQNTALSLYVLDTTQSSAQFATVLALASLPRLILGPFCGVISDWVDRKKLLILLDSISSVVVIIPVILFRNSSITIESIYVIVVVLGFILALDAPTGAGLVRMIVDDKDLSDAYTVTSFLGSIQYILSPMLGAIMYSLFGLKFIFILNGISFMLSALIQVCISISTSNEKIHTKTLKTFKNDFVEGLSYIFKNKVLWNLAITIMIFNFFSTPLFTVGTGYIAKLQFKVSNEQFSFIETVGLIASLMGPFLYSLIKNKISLQNMFQLSIFISAILVLIISLISTNSIGSAFSSYIFYLMIYFVLSLVEGPLNIAIMTLLQSSIDVEYAGRANGIVSTMFMGMAPIGQLCYGVLFEKSYIAIPYIISAIAYVVLVLIYRRKIQHIERLGDLNTP